ncbi:MAG: MiaB/RimO family radical SAM methylthiotransferase [Nitrospirae bacterium]|nr:MiaB/RimO family radical SAM methylthiotransferase [Nitrospirota bacterium]
MTPPDALALAMTEGVSWRSASPPWRTSRRRSKLDAAQDLRGCRLAGTFSLISLGCRVNYADGQAVRRQLEEAGLAYRPMQGRTEADVYVVNTCTVTAQADFDARAWIRRVKSWNPSAFVLATGCYAQMAAKQLRAEGADLVVGARETGRLAEVLSGLLARPGALETQAACPPTRHRGEACGYHGPILSARSRTLQGASPAASTAAPRAWPRMGFGAAYGAAPTDVQDRARPVLKVHDGCDQCCSFCVIPFTRGRSRSLPPAEAVAAYRALVRGGAREVVLSGVHLAAYGRDLDPPVPFSRLLETLCAEDDGVRLRLSSLDPSALTDDLLQVVAGSKKICPHFHVAVQSADPEVLRIMRRPYTVEAMRARISALCERMPSLNLGADVLVGFPGETEDAFERTLRFIEFFPFTYLHVFPYSPRPHTRASRLPDHVGEAAKRRRAGRLLDLSRTRRDKFLAGHVGGVFEAIAEAPSHRDPGEWTATTRDYVRMVFRADGRPRGTVVRLRADAIEGSRLRGMLIGAGEGGEAASGTERPHAMS